MKPKIISIIIYMFSLYGSYKDIQQKHSKGGEFESVDTSSIDVVACLLPVVNTCCTLEYFINITIDTNKLFNISR